MTSYDTLRLDSLFNELARLAIYRVTNYDTNGYIYPKTEMEDINMFFKKYIDLYINNKFQKLDMEMEKDLLIYARNVNTDETSVMCLIILKESIYNAMTGNCLQILDMSKSYVSDENYKNLELELEKYQLPLNSENIVIDIS